MPIPLVDYLKENYREPQPAWLDLARPEMDPETRRAVVDGFLRSRIVYYPGAGRDGQPVKLFNRAHAAHAYIYVDYLVSREELDQNLMPHPAIPARGFRGYRTAAILDLSREELTPYPLPSYITDQYRTPLPVRLRTYAAMYVFERLNDYTDDHGARRFAVLSLNSDGYATYEALFCQPQSVANPFCVVIQDYVWGGNWNRFDQGGYLEGVAARYGVWPELLLVSHPASKPWKGYEPPRGLPDVLEPERGGMWQNERTIYRRSS